MSAVAKNAFDSDARRYSRRTQGLSVKQNTCKESQKDSGYGESKIKLFHTVILCKSGPKLKNTDAK